jgi:hypothetical protein
MAWQAVCAALFGASLGVYSTISRVPADPRFMAASLVKMPILLLLTSVVTVPSLYVFGALRGLRFSAREFAATLMVAHTILAAVLASLAPVIAFFALTTSSYSFMVLLNVFACAIAGMLGIRVFVRALNEPAPVVDVVVDVAALAAAPVATDTELASRPTLLPARPAAVGAGVWQLLGWWVWLYVFVGAQTGWILRPFIGHPDKPFVLFRGKSGGFIEGVLHHLWNALFGS